MYMPLEDLEDRIGETVFEFFGVFDLDSRCKGVPEDDCRPGF